MAVLITNHVVSTIPQPLRAVYQTVSVDLQQLIKGVLQHPVGAIRVCFMCTMLDVHCPQVSDPSGGAMFVSDPKKPVGGHVLAHASTIRISLRKGKGEQRLMKVVDAPNLREAHPPSIGALLSYNSIGRCNCMFITAHDHFFKTAFVCGKLVDLK